ncbi:hypothetical protein EW026_g3911 [Hermanssonia centrifuga]|uniref:Uncharacterized protein n=1 Tax=Hermanssonia centrifuga TaxID=98765 RepID=A0A4S4KIS7_9APHY|nr:hypothetical protein EW026_g3911 [Hermanssonia centrifuga]
MHRDIARRVLFSTIKIHLEPTYFDSEGVHYPGGELGGADDHALLETDTGTKSYKLIDTIVKDHQFASLVKTVVFFAEDSPRTQYFEPIIKLLEALPHLRGFHLVLPMGSADLSYERAGNRCLQLPAFISYLIAQCPELEELTIPPELPEQILAALIELKSLRKLSCKDLLVTTTADGRLPDETLLPGIISIAHAMSPTLCPLLVDLCIEESYLSIIPKDVMKRLKQLDVLDVEEANVSLKRVINRCPALESLTIHDTLGYSDLTATGGLETISDICAVPQDHRAIAMLLRSPNALPNLTSFKFLAYETVLPEETCALLEAFLSGRKGLRRLDIKAIICNVEMAIRLLKVMQKMPGLQVLGFEHFNPGGAAFQTLKHLPASLTHLRFAINGWSLRQSGNFVDQHFHLLTDRLPDLTFLHLFDGIDVPRPGLPTVRNDVLPVKNPAHFDWKMLRFLGVEHSWFDVLEDDDGKIKLEQWPSREVYGSKFGANRMGVDGEWLMRYHREVTNGMM